MRAVHLRCRESCASTCAERNLWAICRSQVVQGDLPVACPVDRHSWEKGRHYMLPPIPHVAEKGQGIPLVWCNYHPSPRCLSCYNMILAIMKRAEK